MNSQRNSLAIAEVLAEAWRGVSAGGVRSVIVMLGLVASSFLPAVLDQTAVQRIAQQESEWISAGGTVAVVQAEDLVVPQACDDLSATQSVIASGSLRFSTGRIRSNPMSALSSPISSISPGLLEVLESLRLKTETVQPGPGAYAYGTDDLSEQLGLAPDVSAYPATSNEGGDTYELQIIGSTQLSRLVPSAAGTVLAVDSEMSRTADVCVVVARPGHLSEVIDLAVIVAPEATAADRVPEPLLYESDFTFRAERSMTERSTRYLWFGGILMCALVLGLPLLFRRSEVGFYLSLGVGRSEVGLMRSIEGLILVVAAAVTVLAGLLITALLRPEYSLFAWSITIPEAMLVLSGAGVLHFAVALLSARFGNAASMIKDR